MAHTSLPSGLLDVFWWLIPLVILVGLVGLARSPVGKGYLGEWLVRITARLRLDKHTYHRVDNVTLPTPDGTTQIDHVIVSRYGVFVIETKNMQGWIFGGENQSQWTQKLYRKSVKFQNPLRQNYKHVKALETTLQVPPEAIQSVVAFVGGSQFKTPMPPNITAGSGFIAYIQSFTRPVLTDEQVKSILNRLAAGRLAPSLATHRRHVNHLKSRSDPNAAQRCPKCGSAMILRTVKSGARAGQRFWGCSTYPKCKIIRNLD